MGGPFDRRSGSGPKDYGKNVANPTVQDIKEASENLMPKPSDIEELRQKIAFSQKNESLNYRPSKVAESVWQAFKGLRNYDAHHGTNLANEALEDFLDDSKRNGFNPRNTAIALNYANNRWSAHLRSKRS